MTSVDGLHNEPQPKGTPPLPEELGQWLTAIGELYIAMGRPPFEATEPTLGVVETLREAAKRLATQAPAPGESPAELVCAQAYQVVGSLLSDLGQFETDRAEKILDNLNQARVVHDDVLPWPSFASPAVGAKAVGQAQASDLHERLLAAADACADEDHKGCRAILNEAMRMLAPIAQPPAQESAQ